MFIFEAVRRGAEGYLLKTLRAEELFDLLKSVFRGEAPMSPAMARKLLSEFARLAHRDVPLTTPKSDLTPREREVLQLLSEGAMDKEIATRLNISQRTVKNHVHNILEKLQLRNRVQAAAYAFREGITSTSPTNKSSNDFGE